MQNDSQKWFEDFEQGNKFQKHSLLTKLEQQTKFPVSPKVRRFIHNLTFCGIGWKNIRLPNGHVIHRRNFCNQPLCPKCRQFVNKRDADRGWQRFFEAIGSDLDASDFSFVSVNGSIIDPSDPRRTRTTSDRRIKRYLEELGSPLLCYGQYELTRLDSRQLRLDWHFICYHPGVDREDLTNHLRNKFPERRAINVKPIRGGRRGLLKNLKSALRYSGKMTISGKKVKNENVDDLIEMISTYERIRSTGLKGVRFEFGFRSWTDSNIIGEDNNMIRTDECISISSNYVRTFSLHTVCFDQRGSARAWSFNHNLYIILVRTEPPNFYSFKFSHHNYIDQVFGRSDQSQFYSQARAPPVR